MSAIGSLINKAMDPDIYPTPKQCFYRFTCGIPAVTLGGAFGPYVLGQVTSITYSPLAGAFAGGTYALFATITSMFFKAFEFESESKLYLACKIITDIALTILTSFLVFNAFGVERSLFKACIHLCLAVPGSIALTAISAGYFTMVDTLMSYGVEGS